MQQKRAFMVCCLLLTVSFLSKAQSAETFKWLAGTWTITTGNGVMAEHWQVLNDSTLAGKSLFIKNNGDSILQETVELARRNGQWYYIPTVQGQNNNQPVRFAVIFQRGTEFISENPAHDFPQRIAYRRIGNNLYASIEGKRKDKYVKQNFDFVYDH